MRPCWRARNSSPSACGPGEDASCLNVYQTRLPTILGVPKSLIDRGGFRFIGAARPIRGRCWNKRRPTARSPFSATPTRCNTACTKRSAQPSTFPADGGTSKQTLKIAGMLDGSVFQGVLLMSEDNFRRLFPERRRLSLFL